MFTGMVGATEKDPCLHFSKDPKPLTPYRKPRHLDPWVWYGTLEYSSLGRFPLVAEAPDKLQHPALLIPEHEQYKRLIERSWTCPIQSPQPGTPSPKDKTVYLWCFPRYPEDARLQILSFSSCPLKRLGLTS